MHILRRGWVAAGDLVEGDEIYLLDGTTAYVTNSELERLAEPMKVYNLEVADFNTYFVGNEAVLVHNTCSEHSKKLRDNLASDGRPVGQGEAAAHIVASGGYLSNINSTKIGSNL